MSKGGKPRDVFDVERIRQIIQLMEEHDLGEVDLKQGDEKIKLRRGGLAPLAPIAAASPPAAGHTTPSSAVDSGADSGADSETSTAGTITIDSPMVGTFYSRSSPEAEPFVKVGDTVSDETVVCIVEAMKVFSEIPAECSGKIVEILVKDQDPVDFGKPMFRVQPAK